MVSYRIVSVCHVNTQYRIESPLPGIAHLYLWAALGPAKFGDMPIAIRLSYGFWYKFVVQSEMQLAVAFQWPEPVVLISKW